METEQAEFKALQKEDKENRRLFEQVIELDFQLEKLEKPLLEAEKNRLNLATQKKAEAEEVDRLKNQRKTLESTQSELENRLKENKRFKKLPAQLSSIVTMRDDLRQSYKSAGETGKEKVLILQKIEAQEKLEKAAQNRVAEVEKRASDLTAELKKLIPEKYAATPADLLNLINKEIEELNEQTGHLRQLMHLTADYREMLQEFDKNETRLAELRSRDSIINSQLITAMELVDDRKKWLEFKKASYDQHRLIASYADERSKLKKGESCPLCFSTDHNLELHGVKPYVNEAKEELEAAQNQFDTVNANYRNLMNSQREIHTQIDQLVGQENQKLNGQIQYQFDKILGFEKRFAELSSNVDSKYFFTQP